MSFDLNLEILFSPYTRFLPFLFVGGGYNTSNSFISTVARAQGGFGFEVLLTKGVGLILFGEYNYMFIEGHLGALIADETDDALLRGGLNSNLYFGGKKKKEALFRKMKTVINYSLIIPYN
jgi:curli production assembly/transport component CsgG